jgi:hypothetical protein
VAETIKLGVEVDTDTRATRQEFAALRREVKREAEGMGDDWEAAAQKVEDSLREAGARDDLIDAARRIGDQGPSEIEKMQRALRDLGDTSKDAAGKVKDSAQDAENALDDVARAADDAGDKIGKGLDDGFDKAREGAREAGDELKGTASEAAASWSGEFDDIGDVVQEGLVGGLGAIGGPVGVAAGILGGVAAGSLITEYTEGVEQLEELTTEIFEAIAEDGATSFASMSESAKTAFIETRAEALLTEHGVKDIASAAEALGVTSATALAAMAGDTEATTQVTEAYNEQVRLLHEQWGYGGDAVSGQIRKLDDDTRLLEREIGSLATATQEADARTDLLGDAMDEVARKTGTARTRADDYADAIRDIPSKKDTKVAVSDDGTVRSTQRRIDGIDDTGASVNVTADTSSAERSIAALRNRVGSIRIPVSVGVGGARVGGFYG